MKKISILLALLLLMCLPRLAGAWTQEFRNDYAEANAIYLWMDSATGAFETTTFGGGHFDWILAVDQPSQQFMYGPPKPTGTAGIYVNFTDPNTTSLSFQWAEVQWSGGSYTLLGSGTIDWSGSGWGYSGGFDHEEDITPIPIPASVLLFGTGILGLGLLGFRRRKV
jgi:hypothetical protein